MSDRDELAERLRPHVVQSQYEDTALMLATYLVHEGYRRSVTAEEIGAADRYLAGFYGIETALDATSARGVARMFGLEVTP